MIGRHRLSSSPAEGTGEQATGRVDVPGEARNGIFKQKVAAALLAAASQQANRCPSGFKAESLVMSWLWLSLLQRVSLLISSS